MQHTRGQHLRQWPFALAALVLAALPAAAGQRFPMQSDLDRCVRQADERSAAPQMGHVQLDLLLRRDGQVYGAHVRKAEGIDDKAMLRCICQMATRWRLPAVGVDTERPYALSFAPTTQIGTRRSAVFLPRLDDNPAQAPMDTQLARTTLELLDDATEAERGVVQLHVGDALGAVPLFREALDEAPSDPVALRGLAEALSVSDGDLDEARARASQLLALDPEGVSGHEAMTHACLARGDDACAVQEFKLAAKAPDARPRGRALSELVEPVRAAAQRLQALAAHAGVDRCELAESDEARVLCQVRRCMDEGVSAFAQEMGERDGSRWEMRAWSVHAASGGRMVVTRPFEVTREGALARRDAVWLVQLGDPLLLKPESAEAREITVRHNRCAQPPLTAQQ